MKKIIYKCDFCHKEIEYGNDMISAEMPLIQTEFKPNTKNPPRKLIVAQKDICSDCVEKMMMALTGQTEVVRH